jgi:carboxypeptidase PM20D1
MLRALAPRAHGLQRRLFQNPERFRPALLRILASRGGEGEAMVRTTRAVTRLSGSAADNVIAERATATVNARIAVGSSLERTVDEVRRAIGDDGVGVELLRGGDPSPVSRTEGAEWEVLVRCISAVFPAAAIAPYVMMQASDSRHFAQISDTVYRFMPFDLTAAERGTLHAKNESIRVATWLRAIDFFDRLLGEL